MWRGKSSGYLFRLERENWKSNIASKPKLRSYIKLKADYGKTEGYIQRTRVKAHRSLLARLKGGTAPAHADFLFFNF